MKEVAKLNYENFFSQSIDLLCIIGTGGFIKHINAAWCHTFGYTMDELIGQNCYELLHPEDLPSSREAIIEGKRTGARIVNYVNRFRHKQGHYLYVEWQALSKDDKTYCTVREIDKLKNTEQELLQEQKRLQAIIDSQNKYLIRLDLDLKFTYVNKKFIEDFAWYYKTENVIGLSIFGENKANHSDRELYYLSAINNPGKILEREEEIHLGEGKIQYLYWQCICFIDSNGKPFEIQCNALDITARKLQEIEEKNLEEEHFLETTIPISTLLEDILLLPLVGTLSTLRAITTMNTILKNINETQAKILILDISGIAIMDTQVANYIFKITKATKLMGCQTTICGISPAVAQTMISLGIDLQEIHTTGDLQNALEQSLLNTGYQLSMIP